MKQKINFPQLIPSVILLLLVAILGINNYIYISSCKDLFIGDQIGHLINSINFYENGLKVFSIKQGFALDLVAIVLYRVFSVNQYAAILANLFFALLLFCSIYSIVFRITENKMASFYSVLLILLYPITFGLSRFYMTEFSLMAATTVFIALLIYSDNFRNTKYSVLAGLALGLGTLTKGSFLIFIFAPLVYLIFYVIKDKLVIKRRRNLISFFMAAIVSSIWFLSHPSTIIADGLFRIMRDGGNNPGLSVFSIKNLFFYLYPIVDFNISPFFFLLFLIALRSFLKIRFRERNLLFLWFIVPYVIFSFFPWKLARYVAPIIPVIAIISSVGISRIKPSFRYGIYLISVLYGVLQFSALSYNIPHLKEECFIRTKFLSKFFSLTPNNYREDFWITRPNQSYTGSLEILKVLKNYQKQCKSKGEEFRICRILNRRSSNSNRFWIEHPLSSSLLYYNRSKGYNYHFDSCFVEDHLKYRNGNLVQDIRQFNAVLVYMPEIMSFFEGHYILVKKVKLGLKGEDYIYIYNQK